MVTVIATGFDGGKRRQRPARVGRRDGGRGCVPHLPRARLPPELERQREQGDGAFAPIHEDDAAAVVSSPRIERTAGENARDVP